MRRRDGGVKLYGPYPYRGRWRLVRREAGQGDRSILFETEEKAREVRDAARKLTEGKSVMEAIDAMVAEQKRRGRRHSTLTSTEDRLYLITGARGGDFPLRRINARVAQRLYDDLTGKVAVATHRQALAMAKTWGRWLVKQQWAKVNPWADIEPIGKKNRGKPQLRVDEARRLAEVCTAAGHEPGAVAVLVALMMALRATEIVSLVGRDIDDGGRLLWVERGKTERSRRTLEVPPVLQPLLLELAATAGPTGRLFPKSRWWLQFAVRDYCKAAGVPRVPPHGLRATHASLATQAGATGHLVAAMLGHTSPTVTHEHYIQPQTAAAAQTGRVLQVIAGGRR